MTDTDPMETPSAEEGMGTGEVHSHLSSHPDEGERSGARWRGFRPDIGEMTDAAERVMDEAREKAERLRCHADRLVDSKQPSNWDTVPVEPARMAALRARLGLTQEATGLASSVNNIEHGYTRPTPRILRELLDVYAAADTTGAASDEIAALRALATHDVAWDYVDSIDVLSGEIDVYDITVPEAGSFVASGIVAHNCHIYTTTTGAMKNAFGGLLNTKRHYTHSWIHETLVDLLAIQREIHSGLFAIMDGTTAGDGPGPRTMRPKRTSPLGTNPFARRTPAGRRTTASGRSPGSRVNARCAPPSQTRAPRGRRPVARDARARRLQLRGQPGFHTRVPFSSPSPGNLSQAGD